MRSKKISLGFVVVSTTTGEHLSSIFTRRKPAREIARAIYAAQPSARVGVQKLEAYVHEGWKRGDSLDNYVEPELLRKLRK